MISWGIADCSGNAFFTKAEIERAVIGDAELKALLEESFCHSIIKTQDEDGNVITMILFIDVEGCHRYVALPMRKLPDDDLSELDGWPTPASKEPRPTWIPKVGEWVRVIKRIPGEPACHRMSSVEQDKYDHRWYVNLINERPYQNTIKHMALSNVQPIGEFRLWITDELEGLLAINFVASYAKAGSHAEAKPRRCYCGGIPIGILSTNAGWVPRCEAHVPGPTDYGLEVTPYVVHSEHAMWRMVMELEWEAGERLL